MYAILLPERTNINIKGDISDESLLQAGKRELG